MRIEPIINYRFGYVQPNGRPKQDLENDLFIQIENYFLPTKKYFPSIIVGFENSPNLRQLDRRYLAGAGINTYVLKKPNKLVHINFYGIYEQSTFKNLDYGVIRLFHTAKGRLGFSDNKFGIGFSSTYAIAVNDLKNNRMRTFVKPFIKITKHAELNIMYDLWQESVVNETSPKQISTLTFGLSIANF